LNARVDAPTSRRGRRWALREDDLLEAMWGRAHVGMIAERLGRTVWGCEQRARVLALGHPGLRYETMRAFCERTGFSRETVHLVARRLGLRLLRRPRSAQSAPCTGARARGRLWAITPEHAVQLEAALLERSVGRHTLSRRGEWGGPRKPPSCRACGTTERPHCSRGLCDRCDARLRRKNKLPPELIREAGRCLKCGRKKSPTRACAACQQAKYRARRGSAYRKRKGVRGAFLAFDG